MTPALTNVDDRTAGYQSWKMLTFIHWRIAGDVIQKLLPEGLTVELYDGSAWLGLVPFSMQKIRPWWSPPVPGLSWFLETNVRTYVRDDRGVRGVWFLSLDANNRIAVSVARTFWHLPYRLARMQLNRRSDQRSGGQTARIDYQGQRNDSRRSSYTVSVRPDLSAPARPATAGTLEHFLVERYLLFAQNPRHGLMTGMVHHPPYLLRTVHDLQLEQTLTAAEFPDLKVSGTPDHVTYADGVDVRISPLRRLDQSWPPSSSTM